MLANDTLQNSIWKETVQLVFSIILQMLLITTNKENTTVHYNNLVYFLIQTKHYNLKIYF